MGDRDMVGVTSLRRMRVLLVVAVVGAMLLAVPPLPSVEAQAGDRPDFFLPFECGQVYWGDTYTALNGDPSRPHGNGPLGYEAMDFNQDRDPNGNDLDNNDAVLASAAGEVRVRDGGGLGFYVDVVHNETWTTRYAHLRSDGRPADRSTVQAGDPIGFLSNSGTIAPHLHYEQRMNGVSQLVNFVELGGGQPPYWVDNLVGVPDWATGDPRSIQAKADGAVGPFYFPASQNSGVRANDDADGFTRYDSDCDGVDDLNDLCPGTLPGAEVDANGCVQVINEAVTVAVILDVSASMRSNDSNSYRQDGASAFIQAAIDDDEIGVARFATTAEILQSVQRVGDHRASLMSLVTDDTQIHDDGSSTNLESALLAGCEVLDSQNGATNSVRAALLLTDGEQNRGSYLNGLDCYQQNGWKVYTVGVSGLSSTGQANLQDIATSTGGSYRLLLDYEPGVNDSLLLCQFQQIRAEMEGDTLEDCEFEGELASGEVVSETVDVPELVGRVTFTNSWASPDSTLSMSLTAPSGRSIDRDSVGDDLTITTGPSFEVFSVDAPEAGEWLATVEGTSVPDGRAEPYRLSSVQIGTRPDDRTSITPLNTPCPIYDSTVATGSGLSGPLAAGELRTIQVAGPLPAGQGFGVDQCMPVGAAAAVVTTTVLDPEGVGNVRLSPAGVTPNGGVVNYAANGLDNSNTFTVPLSVDGAVDAFANGSGTGLRLVVVGFVAKAPGLKYNSVTPCAVADSRPDQGPAGDFVGPFAADASIPDLDVVGTFPADQGGGNTDCGVPAGADAVVINLVAVGPRGGSGGLAAGPAGTVPAEPTTRFADLRLNNATTTLVPLMGAERVAVAVRGFDGAPSTHVRVVVIGYLDDDGAELNALPGCAAFDTRPGFGASGDFLGKRASGSATTYQVTGTVPAAQGGNGGDCGVPDGARSVLINLVAIQPEVVGNFRAYATGSSPTGGVLNFAPLSPPLNNSNAVVVPLDPSGRMDLFTNTAASDGVVSVHARGVILGFYD